MLNAITPGAEYVIVIFRRTILYLIFGSINFCIFELRNFFERFKNIDIYLLSFSYFYIFFLFFAGFITRKRIIFFIMWFNVIDHLRQQRWEDLHDAKICNSAIITVYWKTYFSCFYFFDLFVLIEYQSITWII